MASIATRPCLSSASRYLTISAGDARSAKPSGSKSRRDWGLPGIMLPGRPYANSFLLSVATPSGAALVERASGATRAEAEARSVKATVVCIVVVVGVLYVWVRREAVNC